MRCSKLSSGPKKCKCVNGSLYSNFRRRPLRTQGLTLRIRTMAANRRMHELVVASWNSRGHRKDRLLYLHKLVAKCHVIFIQEHWLYDSELHKSIDGLDNTSMIGVSGMDQTQIIAGRPYGGCAILYDDRMNCKCEFITCESKRLCACILQWPNSMRILFINAYMPVESGNILSLNDFKAVVQCVYDIILRNHNVDRIVLEETSTRTSRDWVNACGFLKNYASVLRLNFAQSRE